MWEDAVRKVQAIIEESQQGTHWIPPGVDAPPDLWIAKSEHDEIMIMFAGNLFISHSSYDSGFIEEFILPAVRLAAGKRYFLLNSPLYSNLRAGAFRHALWINAAIQTCKTVIAVVSARSVVSDWIKWESRMAQAQRHPIIICQLDRADETCEFVRLIESQAALLRKLDFHSQARSSTQQLLGLLWSPEFSTGPWNGRPLGTPYYLMHEHDV